MSDSENDSEYDSEYEIVSNSSEDQEDIIEVDYEADDISLDISYLDKQAYINDLFSKQIRLQRREKMLVRKTSSAFSLLSKSTRVIKNFNQHQTHLILACLKKSSFSKTEFKSVFSKFKKYTPYDQLNNVEGENILNSISKDQDVFMISATDNNISTYERIIKDSDEGLLEIRGLANLIPMYGKASTHHDPITLDVNKYIENINELQKGDSVNVTTSSTYTPKKGVVISNGNVLKVNIDDAVITYDLSNIQESNYLVFPEVRGMTPFSRKDFLRRNVFLYNHNHTLENIRVAEGILHVNGNVHVKINKSSKQPLHKIISVDDIDQVSNDIIEEYSDKFERYVGNNKNPDQNLKPPKQSRKKIINEVKYLKKVLKQNYDRFLIEKDEKDDGVDKSILNTIVLSSDKITPEKNLLLIPHRIYNVKNKSSRFVSNYRIFETSVKNNVVVLGKDVTKTIHNIKHKIPAISKYNLMYFDNLNTFTETYNTNDLKSSFNLVSTPISYSSNKIFVAEILGNEGDMEMEELPEQGVMMTGFDTNMMEYDEDIRDGQDYIEQTINILNFTLSNGKLEFIKNQINIITDTNANASGDIIICVIIAYCLIFGQMAYPLNLTQRASIDHIMKVPKEFGFIHKWHSILLNSDIIKKLAVSKFVQKIRDSYIQILNSIADFKTATQNRISKYNGEITMNALDKTDYHLWEEFRPSKEVASNLEPVISSQRKRTMLFENDNNQNSNVRTVPDIPTTNTIIKSETESVTLCTYLNEFTGKEIYNHPKMMSLELDNSKHSELLGDMNIELCLKALYCMKNIKGIDIHPIPKIDIIDKKSVTDLIEGEYAIKYFIHDTLTLLEMANKTVYERTIETIAFNTDVNKKSIMSARDKFEILREEEKLRLQQKWKDLEAGDRYVAQQLKQAGLDYKLYLEKNNNMTSENNVDEYSLIDEDEEMSDAE